MGFIDRISWQERPEFEQDECWQTVFSLSCAALLAQTLASLINYVSNAMLHISQHDTPRHVAPQHDTPRHPTQRLFFHTRSATGVTNLEIQELMELCPEPASENMPT